jgi:hypothetical protein
MDEHMDVNIIAHCTEHQSSTNTGLLVGICDYISENIKFEFAYRLDHSNPNSTLELKPNHENPQADLFRHLSSLSSGSNKFLSIRFNNLLRAIPPPLGQAPETYLNNPPQKL